MYEDLDRRLVRIAERAGHAVRLRPPTQIRVRGDQRRTRHRVGTAALSVGALGLTATGVVIAGDGFGRSGDGAPIGTAPVSTPPSQTTPPSQPPPPSQTSTPSQGPTGDAKITEKMLLTAADLNRVGEGWRVVSTGSTDDGNFLRCQQDTFAALGATEVLVRTFERPPGIGPATEAGHLIAYFPDKEAAMASNSAVWQWMEDCEQHATGAGGELAWVRGGIAVDTVHRRGPDGPGWGATWGFTFDDENRTDEYGWFDSVGFGFMEQPYLTVVTYTDYGQDANYDLDQLPGVVLLQDSFAKLPI